MVKAIIFDCFGVLATESWLSFKNTHFGGDPETLQAVNELHNQANRGLISRTEAVNEIASIAKISPTEFNKAIGPNTPNEELFAYLSELKADYKLGFLSNISHDFLHTIFSDDQLALFDEIYLSYKTGFIKPQLETYQGAAVLLNVDVTECVMVDDQERNVTGAVEAGMQGVLYKDFNSFKSELDELLADSKS